MATKQALASDVESGQRSRERERHQAIISAAHSLADSIDATFAVKDEPEPECFPDFHRSPILVLAAERLEKLLNPKRLPFGATGRTAFSGTSLQAIMAQTWLRQLLDEMLIEWRMEPLAEDKPWCQRSEGVKGLDDNATTTVRVERGFEPKATRQKVIALRQAAASLARATSTEGDRLSAGVANSAPRHDRWAPYRPASWFKDEFGIPPERLRSARRTDRLQYIESHGGYCYSVPRAMELWSQDVMYLPDGGQLQPA